MKTTSIITIALICGLNASAQSPDKALARVKYSFVHIKDTTQKNNPYTENMLLVVGKNASVYTSADRIDRALAQERRRKEDPKAPNVPFKPVSFQNYYLFAKENLFYTQRKMINEYLGEEQIPKIAWKLVKDTASFSGIHCQKATASFKGRNWIAWYAPELPFQNGPWKLNGLPGLIIEAYDDKKQVQFQFTGIENVTSANVNDDNPFLGKEIKLPDDAKKTSIKEFNRLLDLLENDPQGFHATMSGTDRKSILVGKSSTGIAGPTKSNNPIELPEKNN